ncbi:prolipoprotein diacylglyceryl transferase [Paenibacillus sp. FJAT-26967]|uniref:prolipoprotein diacylglyceryl transferase n=1 Tax=Paenibacillus sp. FJAT-26967 TaxID=1729690 RepID=UPI0008387F7E|nr:prolipoprotein diacylglyceryl transferase family protein [Paenibacillus sp. FJAT-26967]
MDFPVYVNIGFIEIHPHLLFETLAYFIGFRLYLYTRSKEKMPPSQAIWALIGAILGAAAGSKILYWIENPVMTLTHWNDLQYLLEGKTIVGGLLGGLIGVEWTKKRLGHTLSTGDDMTLPLITGMMIGRIGCFLTGLDDHTYGTATGWITGVDFGDGILRHPTQLYEIVFLLVLGIVLSAMKARTRKGRLQLPDGVLFMLFMSSYLMFRFGVDFIKPTPHPYGGLNNIQLACAAGMLYYAFLFRRKFIRPASMIRKGM